MSWRDKVPHIAENKRDIDENKEFDVFMSHNSKDQKEVWEIAKQLKQHQIRPWVDDWELRPGVQKGYHYRTWHHKQ